MRAGPVARVRARVAQASGGQNALRIPDGYQRLGRVLVVKLPEELRRSFGAVGRAYQEELGVTTVLRRRAGIEGEFRLPRTEVIADGPTVTEVREGGIRYRFDASELMFSAGNRDERRRLGSLVQPGEVVADLFAGIGYFTLPALVHGAAARVVACEANPVSYRYLRENARLNHVDERLEAHLGDNRGLDLPPRAFDRVVLGYLPSSLPWVPRALPLVRRGGGWIHVHLLCDAAAGTASAVADVQAAVGQAGGEVLTLRAKVVKSYGPGRAHAVVDVLCRAG